MRQGLFDKNFAQIKNHTNTKHNTA